MEWADYKAKVKEALEKSKFDVAETTLLQALQWVKDTGGSNERLCLCLDQLAWIYVNIRDLDRAAACYKESLDIKGTILGDHNPIVARACKKLATVVYMQKRYDLAEKYSKDALNIFKQTLGIEHEETQQTLSDLVSLLRKMNRNIEANILQNMGKQAAPAPATSNKSGRDLSTSQTFARIKSCDNCGLPFDGEFCIRCTVGQSQVQRATTQQPKQDQQPQQIQPIAQNQQPQDNLQPSQQDQQIQQSQQSLSHPPQEKQQQQDQQSQQPQPSQQPLQMRPQSVLGLLQQQSQQLSQQHAQAQSIQQSDSGQQNPPQRDLQQSNDQPSADQSQQLKQQTGSQTSSPPWSQEQSGGFQVQPQFPQSAPAGMPLPAAPQSFPGVPPSLVPSPPSVPHPQKSSQSHDLGVSGPQQQVQVGQTLSTTGGFQIPNASSFAAMGGTPPVADSLKDTGGFQQTSVNNWDNAQAPQVADDKDSRVDVDLDKFPMPDSLSATGGFMHVGRKNDSESADSDQNNTSSDSHDDDQRSDHHQGSDNPPVSNDQ